MCVYMYISIFVFPFTYYIRTYKCTHVYFKCIYIKYIFIYVIYIYSYMQQTSALWN